MTRSRRSEPTSKSAESLLHTPSSGVECDSREVEQQQKRNEEQEMRTKLLARMRKGGDTLVNSGGDVNKLDNSAVSSIETTSSEQSTQTLMHGEEDGAQESEPLYRSHRFPQRLKRYVGLAPDFDAECENECPNEMKGKKCTDVSCESRHIREGELTTTDVLSMLAAHLPGLLDAIDHKDRTSQIMELKSRRLPGERFGVFIRRLMDELLSSGGGSVGTSRIRKENAGNAPGEST